MSTHSKTDNPNSAEKLYPSAAAKAQPMGKTLGEGELVLRGHSPSDIRDWILALVRVLGITPTTLARAGEVAPSTVNRFLKHPDEKTNLSARTIQKLRAAALNIAKTQLREAERNAPPVSPIDREDPQPNEMRDIAVVGKVEAGVWQEALEWPLDEQYRVHVPVGSRYAEVPVVALEVRGRSMDIPYPEGTILMCVPFYALDRRPRSGERVIVHRQGESGFEATVKEFIIDPTGHAWLAPRSTDPAHQQAIYLGALTERHTDDQILISLLVIGSYRPETPVFKPPSEPI